jgi:hypothetical protein
MVWAFKSRAVVEKKLGKSVLSSAICAIADILLSSACAGFKALAFLRTRGMTIENCESVSEDIEKLVNSDNKPFSCEHSAAWINWQLKHRFSSDAHSAQHLHVVRTLSGELLGFFMYKIRFHAMASHRGFKDLLLGSLMEWQSADQGRLSHATLALLATLAMRKRGVDAVEICSDENGLLRFLKRLMFFHVGELSFVIPRLKAVLYVIMKVGINKATGAFARQRATMDYRKSRRNDKPIVS